MGFLLGVIFTILYMAIMLKITAKKTDSRIIQIMKEIQQERLKR